MTPYILLMASIPLLYATTKPTKSKNGKKVFVVAFFAACIALAAVRDVCVGIDTEQFCNAYLRISTESASLLAEERYELGFTLLCRLLSMVSGNYQTLLVVTSAMVYASVGYYVYKCSENVALSSFLFVAMTIMTQYLNVMRQAVAVAFVLVGMTKLLKGQKIPFVVCVLSGSLFHQTAIAALLYLLFAKIDFNRNVAAAYGVLFVVGFLGVFAFTNLFAGFLGQDVFYDETYTFSNYFGGLIRVVFAAFLAFPCINYLGILRKTCNAEESRRLSLMQHALVLWVFFDVLGMQMGVLERFAYYFDMVFIIAYPLSLRVPLKKEATLVNVTVVCATFLYFVIIGTYRPEWQGAIPYIADMENTLRMSNSIFT